MVALGFLDRTVAGSGFLPCSVAFNVSCSTRRDMHSKVVQTSTASRRWGADRQQCQDQVNSTETWLHPRQVYNFCPQGGRCRISCTLRTRREGACCLSFVSAYPRYICDYSSAYIPPVVAAVATVAASARAHPLRFGESETHDRSSRQVHGIRPPLFSSCGALLYWCGSGIVNEPQSAQLRAEESSRLLNEVTPVRREHGGYHTEVGTRGSWSSRPTEVAVESREIEVETRYSCRPRHLIASFASSVREGWSA